MRNRKASSLGVEAGQATTEYALLIAVGAIAVIAAMLFLTASIGDLFTKTGRQTTSTFLPPAVQCDASYEDACLPPAPPDLDCSDLAARGIPLPVRVVGDDPHGLDDDGDGFGC